MLKFHVDGSLIWLKMIELQVPIESIESNRRSVLAQQHERRVGYGEQRRGASHFLSLQPGVSAGRRGAHCSSRNQEKWEEKETRRGRGIYPFQSFFISLQKKNTKNHTKWSLYTGYHPYNDLIEARSLSLPIILNFIAKTPKKNKKCNAMVAIYRLSSV